MDCGSPSVALAPGRVRPGRSRGPVHDRVPDASRSVSLELTRLPLPVDQALDHPPAHRSLRRPTVAEHRCAARQRAPDDWILLAAGRVSVGLLGIHGVFTRRRTRSGSVSSRGLLDLRVSAGSSSGAGAPWRERKFPGPRWYDSARDEPGRRTRRWWRTVRFRVAAVGARVRAGRPERGRSLLLPLLRRLSDPIDRPSKADHRRRSSMRCRGAATGTPSRTWPSLSPRTRPSCVLIISF